MDNQEIETSIADQKKNPMNKTQNTFLSTSSSRKFRINTKYRLSSSQNGNQFLPPISTSNSDFNFHSINQKSNIYNQSKYGLFRKNYDSNNLKQRLSENKMDMNKKNNELTELKIKYCKLLEENKNVKILISNVLGVEYDSAFSKNEIIEKIKKCSPSEEQQKNLKEVYDIIKLKMDINDKKNKISEINKQIDYYTKNAKTKVINDLENEYVQKCKHQEKILELIQRMEKSIKSNNIKIEELKSQYIYKKDLNIKIKVEYADTEKRIREADDEKERLDNIVLDLREKQRKIQERLKANKYRSENEEALISKKNDLKEIESYMEKRDKIFKDIESRKNNIKTLEKQKIDQNKKIQELSNRNKELSLKMDNYNKERPKLVQKSYEPLNNQRNMKDLEQKLKILKSEYENSQKEHEERQKELQEELSKLKEEIDENNKVIEKNNDEKNKLNEEINDLKNKIEKINGEINENEKKINSNKKDMEDFLQSEEKNKKEEEEKAKLNEEENKKNEEEKKKEQLKKERQHKIELESIKRQINNYNNENKYIEEENNNLKKEIQEFEKTINECGDIDEKIKDAREQLNKLKS